MRNIEKPKKQRTVSVAAIGVFCFIVLLGVSLYYLDRTAIRACGETGSSTCFRRGRRVP